MSQSNGPQKVVVQGAVPVTDNAGSLTVDGTVAVSNFPATQPVSAAALPLPAGAAQDATLTGGTQKTKIVDTGGTNVATVSAAGAVKVDGSGVTQPVSLATAPTTPVTGTFWQATQPVSGTVTVTPPTLTKATQGATGFSVQDLKDAGRTAVILSVTAVASVAVEAMFTLNQWKAGTVTTGTSYTVTAGKTFRLQSIQFGCRFATPSTTVTFANCRFNLRSGNLITSPLVYGDTKLSAANTPTPNSDLAVPDGLEFPAATVLGVSHLSSAATLLLDLVLVGYEY